MVAGVYQSRFRPIVHRVKKLFDRGVLGEIYTGSAYIKRYRTQEYFDSGGWRGTWKVDGGGCLMNQGIHQVDLFLWIMGDPEQVIGITDNPGREVEVETLALAMAKFKSGANGVVEATTLAYPEWEPYMEVIGSRGTMAFSGTRMIKMELIDPTREEEEERNELMAITKQSDAPAEARKNAAPGTAVPTVDMGHTPVIQNFVDAVKTGGPPLVNSTEARKAVAFIQAVYKSSKSGSKPVAV